MRAKRASSRSSGKRPLTTAPASVEKVGVTAATELDASRVGGLVRRVATHSAHAKTPRRAARSTSVVESGAPTKPVKSKAAFVRSLPLSTPAKEVIAQAKAAGISITETHVYGVRAAERAKRKSAAQKGASKPPAVSAPIVSLPSSAPKVGTKAEALLKAVAAEIGLGHAIEVLQNERARVRALIGG